MSARNQHLSVFIASVLLIVIIGFGTSAATTLATGEVVSIELANVTFTGCTGAIFEGSYRIVMKDADGAVVNATTPITNRRIYTTDNGVTSYSDARRADQVILFGEGLPGAAITYGTIRVELGDDPAVSSPTYVFDCATLTVTLIFDSGDDRLNPNTGDLLIALYARTDDSGKPSIHVYQIDANSKGVFIGQFAYSDFEPYLTEPPADNTRIDSIGKATLYALASGEFQIVIGLDAEGKQYSVIFNGLPPRNIRLMSAPN